MNASARWLGVIFHLGDLITPIPWRRLIVHLAFGIAAAITVKFSVAPEIITLVGTRPGVTRCGEGVMLSLIFLAIEGGFYSYYLQTTRTEHR